MASFFSRLFGRNSGDPTPPAKVQEESEAYNDLLLVATPIKEGSQYRLSGRIEKHDGDRLLSRRFIRADLFTSQDDTVAAAFRKARQIVDQTGPSLFSDGADDRQV